MKVTLEPKYRELYTLEDLDRAKAVIACEKDDLSTPSEYANYAASALAQERGTHVRRIIEASAHTALNGRAWDSICEDSRRMDVWIEFLAETGEGYIKGGACLSDIWAMSSDDRQTEHMYCVYYKEER